MQSGQTDRASAPQTAASPGRASGREEAASHPAHVTTVDTLPPEAEEGPSGAEGELHRGIPLTKHPYPVPYTISPPICSH